MMRNWMMSCSAAVMMAGAAVAQDADTVVATVNGTEITLGHMVAVYDNLPEQYLSYPPNVLWQGVLDQLINQQLLAEAPEATESPRVRKSLENERRALLAAQAAGVVAAQAVTDEALQTAYATQFSGDGLGREFNASHILVETESEALTLVADLMQGADFAATAREHSTGPSGPNGGELGWFSTGMMVAPFQAAVETLNVGEVSAPVQTQFGWHVIKLNDAREQAAHLLEEVRAELADGLQQQAIADALEALNAVATIDRSAADALDPALLSAGTVLAN
ncbi:MAG: peptidylprolyl isomerase [Paracoccaceae bacterium]